MHKILTILAFLFIAPLPAQAQLIGTDTAPGSSCAGFAQGATRMTADANQDGKNVILICDGTTWEPAASDGDSGSGGSGGIGGGGSGSGALIDRFAATGLTVDPVTIDATGNKWPDYILCELEDPLEGVFLLGLLGYESTAGMGGGGGLIYVGVGPYVSFTFDGNYLDSNMTAPNCGASAGDINTICDEGRCGFYGGGLALANGVSVGGSVWYLANPGESCSAHCVSRGLLYDTATESYAGSGGNASQCQNVLNALGIAGPVIDFVAEDPSGCDGIPGLGCFYINQTFENPPDPPIVMQSGAICTVPTTTANASFPSYYDSGNSIELSRACAS